MDKEQAVVEKAMRMLFEQGGGLAKALHEFRALEEEVNRLRRDSPSSASATRKLRQLEQLAKTQEYMQRQEKLLGLVTQIQTNLNEIGFCLQRLAPVVRPACMPGPDMSGRAQKNVSRKFV